jgi:PAS domain-containing protein
MREDQPLAHARGHGGGTKEQLPNESVELRQQIAESEALEAERLSAARLRNRQNQAGRWIEQAILTRKTWLPIACMFVLLCILVWLDEILDLPHFLLGAPQTPVNWHEAISQVLLIAVVGLFAVSRLIHDATELKLAEEELRQVNQALRMFNECNQVLVRATDESGLLDDVCRIIVEDGGYRLAWVGFAERDETKTVRPVAQAGFEDGYLETVNITWADSERGRGPTGTAIRTGEPAICRHILTDPDYAPWREGAIRRGYASSIALPLAAEGQVFGALNIYAVEPDAFDVEEVKLLAELANDLAYGIIALRTRVEHQRAEEALRESEDRYRDLVEHSQDLICTHDLEGRILSVNQGAAKLLGYDQSALLKRNFTTLHLRSSTSGGRGKDRTRQGCKH